MVHYASFKGNRVKKTVFISFLWSQTSRKNHEGGGRAQCGSQQFTDMLDLKINWGQLDNLFNVLNPNPVYQWGETLWMRITPKWRTMKNNAYCPLDWAASCSSYCKHLFSSSVILRSLLAGAACISKPKIHCEYNAIYWQLTWCISFDTEFVLTHIQ